MANEMTSVVVVVQATGNSAGSTRGKSGSNGLHASVAAARRQWLVPGIWQGLGKLGRALVCALIRTVLGR